jgi:cobalt-zinc-cadmium efflux system outer membrane protein
MNLPSIDLIKIPTASRLLSRFLLASILTLSIADICLATPSGKEQAVSPEPALTLDQAVQLTLEQHPQLTAFLHRRNAFQGLIDEVGVGRRPTISLRVEEFAGSGERENFESAQSTLSINWISQGTLIDSRVQSARTAASQLDIQQEIKALDLSAQTARLFIQTLVAKQRLTLTQQAVDQARLRTNEIKKRVDAGKSPEFEHLQARVYFAQRQLEAEDQLHELDTLYYRLSGQWSAKQLGQKRRGFRLVGELYKTPVLEDTEHQFDQLAENPSLLLLATQQRITQSEIELARIESRPQWEFSVGARRFEATDDVSMVAGISIPLGNDRSSAGKIARLHARQAEYGSESDALKRQLDTQLYVLLQEIKHSHHVIETLREQIIPALNLAHKQAQRAYENGQLGYQPWTTIVQQQLGVQQALLSAFEAVHLQHIELQRLTGTTLTF